MRGPKSKIPKRKPPRKPRVKVADVNDPLARERHTPNRTRDAAEAMYGAMGGKDGVLALLEGVPDTDTKAEALRNLLMDPASHARDTLGRPRLSFAAMRQRAGYSAKDVFELFNDRQHVTALIVAAAAKPRLVGELVDAASAQLVPCLACGATKRIAELDEDGEFTHWRRCEACDEHGLIAVHGDAKARELYFSHFGFKENSPLVSITNNSADNRAVNFVLGGPGTAPSPVSMIRALDQVRDAGPKALNAPGISADVTVIEAELVKK